MGKLLKEENYPRFQNCLTLLVVVFEALPSWLYCNASKKH